MKLPNFNNYIIFFFLLSILIISSVFDQTSDSNIYFKKPQEKISQNSPSLEFSSYLGGSDDDLIYFSEIDYLGNLIFYAYSPSDDFPKTVSSFPEIYNGFLVKLSPKGELVFSTPVRVPSSSKIHSLSVDANGNIYLAGETDSPYMFTKNAYDDSFGGETDGFLMKYNSNGSVDFSTYVGGSSIDSVRSLEFDNLGNIFVSGITYSQDFPIINPLKLGFNGGIDGFLMKFSSNGTGLLSTLVGGSLHETINHLRINSDNSIFIAGDTNSTDFPTTNSAQNSYNGEVDGFLVKLSSNLTIEFSTYIGTIFSDSVIKMDIDSVSSVYMILKTKSFGLGNIPVHTLRKFNSSGIPEFSLQIGGSSYEGFNDIKHDSLNNIYLSGWTFSQDFPTTMNAFNSDYGGLLDGFFIKYSSNGTLLLSTYIGGSSGDNVSEIEIDNQDNLYLAGWTYSTDFPLVNQVDSTYGGSTDIFLVKISSNDSLSLSTYFGGSSQDDVVDLKIDSLGYIRLQGITKSTDFPVTQAIQTNNSGKTDIFALKLNFLLYFDNDGMDDYWEIFFGLNPYFDDSLDDFDKDGIINKYEFQKGLNPSLNDANEDKDQDGMPNLWEFQMNINAAVNDALMDNDQDRMPNLWEFQMGLNASFALDAGYDPDGDGLTNLDEFIAKTSPYKKDTDNDGMDDYYEIIIGLNPILDDSTFDNDSDLVSNLVEFKFGTDPLNILSFPIFSINIFYVFIVILFFLLIFFAIIFLIIRIYQFKSRFHAPTIVDTYFIWKGKFKVFKEYQLAISKGAKTKVEFNLVKSLNAPSLKIAKEIQQGRFPDYEQYITAKSLGASNIDDYKLIVKLNAPDLEIAYDIEQGGFPSYELYKKALLEGFFTFEDYLNKKLSR